MPEKHAQCLGEALVPGEVASVAIAVLRGARSVRSVAFACSVSVQVAHKRLVRARDLGLVDWEPGLQATLRSGVRLVRLPC